MKGKRERDTKEEKEKEEEEEKEAEEKTRTSESWTCPEKDRKFQGNPPFILRFHTINQNRCLWASQWAAVVMVAAHYGLEQTTIET